MFTKRNEKGFTLMEMLIVVAIIAILVAVSIPVFTSQLEKAREATDAANLRAAKAVAVAQYLTGEYTVDGTTSTTMPTGSIYYVPDSGALTATAPAAYGKGTTAGTDATARTSQIIQITFSASDATAAWVAHP